MHLSVPWPAPRCPGARHEHKVSDMREVFSTESMSHDRGISGDDSLLTPESARLDVDLVEIVGIGAFTHGDNIASLAKAPLANSTAEEQTDGEPSQTKLVATNMNSSARQEKNSFTPTPKFTPTPHPWEAVLPAVPGADFSTIPRKSLTVLAGEGRTVRQRLDLVGNWDRVVACATYEESPGQIIRLLNGVAYIFLTPQALAAALPNPAAVGIRMTKVRLLTLLSESLETSDFIGTWIFGLSEERPYFLPKADLEPMGELLNSLLVLARAHAGVLSPAQAYEELRDRSFFCAGAWDSHEGEQHHFPLYLSPLHLIHAGGSGNVSTLKLREAAALLATDKGLVDSHGSQSEIGEGRGGALVVEPTQPYALYLPYDVFKVEGKEEPLTVT